MAARRTEPTCAVAPCKPFPQAALLIIRGESRGQHASGAQGSSLLHVSAHRPYLNIAGFIFERGEDSFPNFGNHAT